MITMPTGISGDMGGILILLSRGNSFAITFIMAQLYMGVNVLTITGKYLNHKGNEKLRGGFISLPRGLLSPF
jgi:hypothetical protein